MFSSTSIALNDFLRQAIDLNSYFIKLKIQAEAELLLPYENQLRELKSSGQPISCSSEAHTRINSIIKLRHELKQMQKLTQAIESASDTKAH